MENNFFWFEEVLYSSFNVHGDVNVHTNPELVLINKVLLLLLLKLYLHIISKIGKVGYTIN